MEKRIDRLASAHIDLCVATSTAFGSAAGVEAAHELGIDRQVAQRVLLKGGPRRDTTLATLALSSRDASHT